jgi:hypothetical protein
LTGGKSSRASGSATSWHTATKPAQIPELCSQVRKSRAFSDRKPPVAIDADQFGLGQFGGNIPPPEHPFIERKLDGPTIH